ncbi:MAG TPA: phosphatase PAP2 family protein, partial [Longimicrobiales bacterium]|nr:phosphatase PAP2 family protein [Longimicrobiales bacterium]
YFIIYIPPFILYMRKQRETQRQMIFNMLLSFFGHYVFFIYFPVSGPRYLFAAPVAGEISRGWFYRFAHKLLEAGSSRGAAFPSSHVGVAAAQTAFTFAKQRYVAPVVLLLSVGLAVGAVYGGFHYGTDALAGLAWGLFLFAIAPRVAGWLGR